MGEGTVNRYGFWRPISDPRLGLATAISQELHEMDLADPTMLPDLRRASTFLIASDYGGEHRGARYQTVSFIIVDFDDCRAWSKARTKMRQEYLPTRSMAFKDLKDRHRWCALGPFLAAADHLNGLCVTFAFDTSIATLFDGGLPVDLRVPALARYRGWDKQALEKLARVAHLLNLLLAGMSRPGQNVLWITDNDAIAANQQLAGDAGALLDHLGHEYMEHRLGELTLVVAGAVDPRDRQLAEDLLAIPDLAAGAIAEYMAVRRTAEHDRIVPPRPSQVFIPARECDVFQPDDRFIVEGRNADGTWTGLGDVSAKTAFIVRWLGARNGGLRRLVWAIAPSTQPGQCLMGRIAISAR